MPVVNLQCIIAWLACGTVTLSILHSPAPAVTIETVPVRNGGNASDTRYDVTGYGSVDYDFHIGKYEVTNAQYVEFLNGVDPTGANTLELFDTSMMSSARGGINFAHGAANGSKYSVKPGRNNNPVVFVSWYDAIRFVNWLHNGQGSSDTETGAYTLLGGTPMPDNGNSITRSPGAKWWLPNEDEWYKAAYHQNDGVTGNYWDYPTSTNAETFSAKPPGSAAPNPSNTANVIKDDHTANGYDDGYAVTGSALFNSSQNYLTDVGAYPSSLGPYGTLDQAGNVMEWTETFVFGSSHILRGGSWDLFFLLASSQASYGPQVQLDDVGFRVARRIPEPDGVTLCWAGLIMLALWRARTR